jgi:mannose-6-phosphate isomerase-like protein (cupin superfamily)
MSTGSEAAGHRRWRRSGMAIKKSLSSSAAEPGMIPESKAVVVDVSDRQREGWDDATRGSASWFTLLSGEVTPTNAMSAGIMEIPPNGGALKPHRHTQPEIYFVHEGSGFLTVDGVVTAIAKGMVAFVPGDAEHSLRNDADGVLRIFYVFPTDRFADVVYRFPPAFGDGRG